MATKTPLRPKQDSTTTTAPASTSLLIGAFALFGFAGIVGVVVPNLAAGDDLEDRVLTDDSTT